MVQLLPPPEVEDDELARRLRRSPVTVALVVVAAVGLVGAVTLVALVVRARSRPVPSFPSLAERPDPSLHGTVAYLDDASRCVRIVAAAGRPSREVFCLPAMDPEQGKALGKEIGPQLVWRPDGRLEVTMFRMTDPPGPGFRAGWQKVVDVATGAVEDAPAAAVPASPDLGTRPTTSPDGVRVAATSAESSGKVTVALTGTGGTRTLLSAQGPSGGGYRLLAAFWEPGFRWVAVDDGRILVVTTGDQPVARVLTGASGQLAFGGEDGRIARFAVTAADLLPAGG